MNNTCDLYVSFASQDNLASEENRGWVDAFIKYFSYFFERSNHNTPNIELSKSLEDSDAFKPPEKEIYDVALVFLSENYLNHKQCLKELDFLSGLKNQPKFFFIEIDRLPEQHLPDIAKISPVFMFYKETETGVERLDFQYDAKYWFNLLDLSYDINNSIDEHNIQQIKGKVYLAETTSDQIINRENLKRELILNHYDVFPKKLLPYERKSLEQELETYASQIDLSIHIIGKNYLELNEEEDISLVELQNQIYSKLCYQEETDQLNFFRIIWVPPGIQKDADELQSKYIEQLKKNKELLIGAEIAEIPFEDLKSIVLQRISSENDKVNQPEIKNGNGVYLIFDPQDQNKIEPIEKMLIKNKIQTTKLDFNSKKINLYENHKQNLLGGEGIIIYYGQDNKDWIKSKLKDIIKAPGYGRKEPFKIKGLIVENELSGIDEKLLQDFKIIKNDDKLEDNLKAITIK